MIRRRSGHHPTAPHWRMSWIWSRGVGICYAWRGATWDCGPALGDPVLVTPNAARVLSWLKFGRMPVCAVFARAIVIPAALTGTLTLGACSTGDDTEDPDQDARNDASTEIRVELGGADDEGLLFVDWSSGDATPKMVRGPQGGQHIWVRTRSEGLWHKKARIDVTMTLIDSGNVVKPGTVPVMPTLEVQEDGSALSPGITAYVKCPCQIVGRAVRVRAEIVDLYGLTGAGEATIHPTWYGDCNSPPSGNCAEQ